MVKAPISKSAEFSQEEFATLPNLLALARMHIGAQLAQGAEDKDGRAIELLAAINSINAKLQPQK